MRTAGIPSIRAVGTYLATLSLTLFYPFRPFPFRSFPSLAVCLAKMYVRSKRAMRCDAAPGIPAYRLLCSARIDNCPGCTLFLGLGMYLVYGALGYELHTRFLCAFVGLMAD